MHENAIRCDCGKLIAREKDGKIFVWCKQCRKEVEIPIQREPQKKSEPEPKGVSRYPFQRYME